MHTALLSPADVKRDDATFPILNEEEMASVKACGQIEKCRPGQVLFEAGEHPVDFFVVLSGSIEVFDTSGDKERLLLTSVPGSFIGNMAIFAGRPAIVACRAAEASEVVRLSIREVRHLLVLTPSLSEKWINALLRRSELIEANGLEGLRIFGPRTDAATLDVQEFLHRNGVAHHWIDSADPANASTVAALGPGPLCYPVVAWSRNILFQDPSLRELACRVGVARPIPSEAFDTVIVGGGPAGLGAAVYAASEGLKTVVLDRVGPGGQAGSSSRIENFAGFPAGLTGRDLALRTYLQALKFGAIFSAPVGVKNIRCLEGGMHQVITDDGTVIRTRTVILAVGVSYRSPDVPRLNELRGLGVYYSATQVEALLCRDQPVHIIGAGNSAGQAAMYLSKYTDQVRLVVRGGDLHKSMSSYLSERVDVNPRIKVMLHTEMRALEGTSRLERVHLENTQTGEKTIEESGGIFVFIGAKPCTDFLADTVKLDDKGFIVTGNDLTSLNAWSETDRQPSALETSCPGIFAAGDCRSRTTKRVAFAIGDGALAVTCVHDLMGTYN